MKPRETFGGGLCPPTPSPRDVLEEPTPYFDPEVLHDFVKQLKEPPVNKDKNYLVIAHDLKNNTYKVLGEKGYEKKDAEAFAHERAEADRENEVLVCKVMAVYAVNKPEVKRYAFED